jgi:hypothetical protein
LYITIGQDRFLLTGRPHSILSGRLYEKKNILLSYKRSSLIPARMTKPP